MTTIADDLAKRRPLPVLTRENYQRCFELAEMHFEAEGIFHTISEPQPNSSYLQQRMDKLSLDGKEIDKSDTPLTREPHSSIRKDGERTTLKHAIL